MINKTLADQVYEKLEKDILTGVYNKGEILTEAALCENLGVSRTPVREAVRRLEQDHILESTGKGLVVRGITAHDIEIIYTIRASIEGLAAAECARKITDEQIDELKEITELQEFYAIKRDNERVKAMDSAFHEKIYQFSGSVIYYETLMPLHRKVQKARKRSIEDKSRAMASVEEHRKIFDAIAKRDAAAAQTAANAHVMFARAHMLEINAFED